MKNCPNCNTPLNDDAAFCTNCGMSFANQNPNNGYRQSYQQMYNQPAYDLFDHTAEFSPEDISENKLICMLVYLLGLVGVLLAFIGAKNSKYTKFHIKQMLKFIVIETLMWIIAGLTCFLVLPLIAAGIMSIVFFVIKMICFFQVCEGKAKEPAIIRSFNFLK